MTSSWLPHSQAPVTEDPEWPAAPASARRLRNTVSARGRGRGQSPASPSGGRLQPAPTACHRVLRGWHLDLPSHLEPPMAPASDPSLESAWHATAEGIFSRTLLCSVSFLGTPESPATPGDSPSQPGSSTTLIPCDPPNTSPGNSAVSVRWGLRVGTPLSRELAGTTFRSV